MKKIRIIIVLAFAVFGLSFTLTDHGKYFDIAKNLEIYTNIFKELNTYFVDDVDPGKLMRTGVNAMLKSLDPYTTYYSEAEIEKYRFMTEGKYRGIGAVVKEINGKLTIFDEYKDSPAYKSGMRIGDVILAIDGRSTDGKTSAEMSEILKGSPDTEVKIKIQHVGKAPEDVILIRDDIQVENVPHYEILEDGIAYIVLTTFTRNASKNIKDAFIEMKNKDEDLKGVIIDLRSNGGGLLSEAVKICNIFIPKGEQIVSTRGKVKDWDKEFKTLSNPEDENIPVAILINNNSASASEIVSGSFQDLDRGVIIGQLSYGKGLVQNTKEVGYNTKVKLTTAKYYIPSGRCIQAIEYKDGKPVHIEESARAKFSTKNNRTVLDGGGILPDVILKDPKNNAVIQSVLDDYYLFNFVNEYSAGLDSSINPITYEFTDFEKFISYLDKHNFGFETGAEKKLKEFQESTNEAGLEIQMEIDKMKTVLLEAKKKTVLENQELLSNMISSDIISRFHFHKGKYQNQLRHDSEVEEAKRILLDTSRYNSLLGK